MLVRGYTFSSGLTSFQRAVLRPLEALRRRIQPTHYEAAKTNFPLSTHQGFQPHRPASQTGRKKIGSAGPADLSDLSDPPAIQARIIQVLRGSGIRPLRPLIDFRRTFHAQGFM